MKRLYRIIYLYEDVENLQDFKIGKADRIASSSEECAKIRIKEQIVAGFKGNVKFIAALEITNEKIDSLTVESFIHDSIENMGYERLHRKIEFSDEDVHLGLTEWFRMKYLSIDEVRCLVRKLHAQINGEVAPKPYIPRFYQDIVSAIKHNIIDKEWNFSEQIQIGSELAPRFGKTLGVLNDFMLLYEERGIRILRLPAYVLTAHASFSKEISLFSNFYNVYQLNSSSDTIAEDLFEAEKTKRPIIIYESLSMQEEKIKIYSNAMKIFSKDEIYSLIDESDFGAHTENSKEIIKNIPSKITERTTGTFIERALKGIDDVGDNIIIFTQTDMQLIKKGTHPILNLLGKENASDNPRLNKVYMKWTKKEAMNSCIKLPEIKMIKLDLTSIYGVQQALRQIEKFGWSKCLKNVNRNWNLLGSLWKAIYDRPNMNMHNENFNSSLSIYLSGICPLNVSEIFGAFPNKKEHHSFCVNLQNELGKENYIIFEINGDITCNKKVEIDVKRLIESNKLDIKQGCGKKIILVSKDMGARSFSISEIDTVFLMFDQGMISQAAQKISRAFTAGKDIYDNEKISCNVVSLSLDSQRTHCPIDLFIIHEVARISETYHVDENIIPVTRNVAACYNVWRNDVQRGIIPYELDQYSQFLLEGSSDDMLRIAASTVSVNNVSEILLKMNQELLNKLLTSDITRKGEKNKGRQDISLKDVRSYYESNGSSKENNKRIITLEEKLTNLIRDINFCAPELCMYDSYEKNSIEDTINSLCMKEDLHNFIENDLGFDIKLAQFILPYINKKLLNTALYMFKNEDLQRLTL